MRLEVDEPTGIIVDNYSPSPSASPRLRVNHPRPADLDLPSF